MVASLLFLRDCNISGRQILSLQEQCYLSSSEQYLLNVEYFHFQFLKYWSISCQIFHDNCPFPPFRVPLANILWKPNLSKKFSPLVTSNFSHKFRYCKIIWLVKFHYDHRTENKFIPLRIIISMILPTNIHLWKPSYRFSKSNLVHNLSAYSLVGSLIPLL